MTSCQSIFILKLLTKKITLFSAAIYTVSMNEELKPNAKIIGYREWISLPGLKLVAIKGKVDTGAKTSSLHAFDIHLEKEGKRTYVRFKVHPLQGNEGLEVPCRAPLLERRTVTDSGGHKELRYVIRTTLIMGGVKKKIELTLTDRSTMKYRMLIGRSALEEFYIDPSQSYLTGKTSKQKVFLKEVKKGEAGRRPDQPLRPG